MAFGKKKQSQEEAAAAPEPETQPDEQPLPQAEDEELGTSTFEGSSAAEPQEDAITAGLAAPQNDNAAADPLGGDLLNMFQTSKIETEDLSVVLDLAGEVEMDDLLEELHTVALALGCQLEEVSDGEAIAA
jgi:hypothetical protein